MMQSLLFKVCLTLIFIEIKLVKCLDNGLVLTPPMGWLAWERFKCTIDCNQYKGNCISEELFMQMADHLVKDGYRDAGYKHINIDDCWMSHERGFRGRLTADPVRFPRGIKFLADHMHAKGLKLGIYQDFGVRTCMGFPGIIGHMEQDAKTFADWDVDMVKLDGCHSHPKDMDKGYVLMGHYLNQTRKPMIYSCSWPYYQLVKGMEPDYKNIAKHCNMWRMFDDIQDLWTSIQRIIDFFGDNQEVLTKYVGPGHWSDPDMLVIGNFHLSHEQAQIQMSVWAILAAPLLMSNDLRSIDSKSKEILLNHNVIAINQDPLGIPGKRIYKKDGFEIWKRPIMPVYDTEKSYALLFLSRRDGGKTADITFQLQQFGLENEAGYHLTELYHGGNYGLVQSSQSIKIELNGVDSVMLRAEVLNK